jgi:hypothetical protein
MNEISEIQNILFYSLKQPSLPMVCGGSILDYFIFRQYIQLYSQSFIRYAFDDFGDKLSSFADAIDIQHPDVCFACDSNFDLKSDFSTHVLEVFDVAKLSFDRKMNRILPILNAALKSKFSKVYRYLSDIELHIRLLKDTLDRDYMRQSCSEKVLVDIAKPDMWHANPSTFKGYVRNCSNMGYYGFQRITWTNAAIIISKICNSAQLNVLVKTAKVFSPLPPMINDLIDRLDSFPDAGNRAIFDKFWQLETKKGSVLLGEREKKCFFIVCWS